jgi:hypothetical protein
MSVLTPTQCEEELRRLSHKLEERTDAFAGLLMEAAEADVRYRVEYAKALLAAEGSTVAEREARALLAVEEERLLLTARKDTEAIADACREAVRSLRDQLSACQSANANVRFQAGLS